MKNVHLAKRREYSELVHSDWVQYRFNAREHREAPYSSSALGLVLRNSSEYGARIVRMTDPVSASRDCITVSRAVLRLGWHPIGVPTNGAHAGENQKFAYESFGSGTHPAHKNGVARRFCPCSEELPLISKSMLAAAGNLVGDLAPLVACHTGWRSARFWWKHLERDQDLTSAITSETLPVFSAI